MQLFFVTGAAGFIGFHLTRELLKSKKNTIVGFDNLNDYYDPALKNARLQELLKHKNFIFIKGDLCDKECLSAVFLKYNFDYVINLAAQAGVRYSLINPDAYINSNIIGFYNILEMVKKSNIKHFVYASSSSVYGNQVKTPFCVKDKTDCPVSLYAATKKANELLAYSYCKTYNIKATGLRFFTVYGPWGRPDMAYFSFTKNIIENKPIKLFNNGNMLRDFTYIDDIVTGIISTIFAKPDKDKSGVYHNVYNIGNNNPTNLLDFLSLLEKTIGKEAIIEFLPMQNGDVLKTYADIEDFSTKFSFRPNTDLVTGLRKFYKWYISFYGVNNEYTI